LPLNRSMKARGDEAEIITRRQLGGLLGESGVRPNAIN